MASIFISYNRQSAAIAGTLADDIKELGHTVWFDHDLSGGQAWWDQILSTVRDCAVFVFVLDPESLDSAACKREYSYAFDLGKPILPVLVSGEVAIHLLPPALSEIQFVDYRNQDRGAAFRLARALATVRPPKPLPSPLPAPPKAPISYLGSLAQQVETSAALTYEEQSALVVDLKRSMRDPATAGDVRTLLLKLRGRHDLYATIADEIDDLLGKKRGSSAVPPLPPVPPPQPPPSEIATPTWRERRIGARNMSLIGAAIGILWLMSFAMRRGSLSYMLPYAAEFPWYVFPIGGAIAGVIAGVDRGRTRAARVGMGVAALFIVVEFGRFPPYSSMLLVLSASPLGALVGKLTKRRSRQP